MKMDLNMSRRADLIFIPGGSKWVMLALLFLWSLAQPLAVIESISIDLRYQLFFWKNILGIVVIGYGLAVILANLSQYRYPLAHAKLFWLSMLFPSYSLFNMLFREQGTSIEEQILYFLWPLALFVIFPAFFPTESDRRRGIIVLWLANLAALLYAIVQGAGDENLARWLDYRYRVSFDFLQPNIYSASWSIVFASSIYFYMMIQSPRWKKFMWLLCGTALVFIFLARSESTLLFCLGILVTLFITNRKWDKRIVFGILHFASAVLLLAFSNILFDVDNLNAATSGRVYLWERAWSNNLGETSFLNYFTGRASLIASNLKYTGERSGFQAVRAQGDNVYLALFFQNGLIGFGLFFLPLLLLLIHLRKINSSIDLDRSLNNLLLGIWVGVFLQIWGTSVIPSFGNVTNIFLLTVTAPAIVQMVQQPSVAEYQESKRLYPKQKSLFQKSA